jgi:hypothetical protein
LSTIPPISVRSCLRSGLLSASLPLTCRCFPHHRRRHRRASGASAGATDGCGGGIARTRDSTRAPMNPHHSTIGPRRRMLSVTSIFASTSLRVGTGGFEAVRRSTARHTMVVGTSQVAPGAAAPSDN